MDKRSTAAAMRQMYARLEEETPRVAYNERTIDRPAEGIVLINPKYPHNVGAAVRAASCFACPHVWITGERVPLEPYPGYRLPREERMKGYRDVTLRRQDDWPRALPADVVPVAVELRANAELLPDFIHPRCAVYVFGPEDGALDRSVLTECHRFVVIPTRHCTNLGAAVYMVLYDRLLKAGLNMVEGTDTLDAAG